MLFGVGAAAEAFALDLVKGMAGLTLFPGMPETTGSATEGCSSFVCVCAQRLSRSRGKILSVCTYVCVCVHVGMHERVSVCVCAHASILQ
jgi:hypothetical protein